MPRTVLVIDDEPDLRKLLDYNLSKSGYLALTAKNGETGLELARKQAPHLIVLDVMMPGLDGWEVCRRLRQDPATAGIPVIMLTSKAEEADRVLGLEIGADDYVTKPFGIRELLARIKALLRRSETAAHPVEVRKVGALIIDAGRRKVTAAGREIALTTTEFNLLKALADREERVMTREDLIACARGEDVIVTDRAVDVHMVSLRRKLGRHGDMIETVRGVGYRLGG